MKAITKRLRSLLIACVLLAGLLPLPAAADVGNFTITMPEEIKAAPGETIQVPVVVKHTADVTHYNSFDMSFTYDPSLLKLTSKSIGGMSVTTPKNGTVRLLRYGGDLRVDSTVFTLTFQTLRSGKTTIAAANAEVGITETAHMQDASAAVVRNDVAVEIGEAGIFDIHIAKTSGGTVSASTGKAAAGETVSISVTPRSGYRLKTLTVTAANGENISVSADENGKFSFIMPDADVTIKATFTAKSLFSSDDSNPRTGDDFDIVAWNAVAVTSLLALAVLTQKKKKLF